MFFNDVMIKKIIIRKIGRYPNDCPSTNINNCSKAIIIQGNTGQVVVESFERDLRQKWTFFG